MTAAVIHPSRIAFRTDASLEIGTGHVMRCLTLADKLREGGAECVFLCRPHAGHLMSEIAARGHRCLALRPPEPSAMERPGDLSHSAWLGADWESDAAQTREALAGGVLDWLVVDHYALDHRWEQALRRASHRLMVMDDLADRRHDCDLLLDLSLGREEGAYAALVPDTAETLLGPRYALLRPEFAQLRPESLARREAPELRRLLVTMGGVDRDNATGRVLDALDASALPSNVRITVIMGPHAPWLGEVKARAARMRFATQVRVGVEDMARVMADSDLAIGAAGGTSWERCCMGLPTFAICLADNQHQIAVSLQEAGAGIATTSAEEAVHYLENYDAMGKLESLLSDASRAAARVTDGRGSERVCERLVA